MHDYRLFGLRVRSAIDLPDLIATTDDGVADVTISLGELGEQAGPDAHLRAVEGGVVMAIADVARFAILGGDRIIVDSTPGVDERNVRLFLLGSAMGMLLHQRGMLPFHANAVEVDGKAFVFMGHSGAGKSTLAAWFHDQGYRVIADDVCVVSQDDAGQPFLFPGLPRLRLWREALEESGRDAAAFAPSFSGETNRDKYDVPLESSRIVQTPSPLGGVYLLVQGERFGVGKLEGIAAAEALFANTYRGAYIESAGGAQVHWQACIGLIGQIPVYRVERQWGFERMAEQNQMLLRHLTG